MPSEETGCGQVVCFGDGVLVKFVVVRVLEGDVLQAFVFFIKSIADDLDLGLMRNGLEIRVKD